MNRAAPIPAAFAPEKGAQSRRAHAQEFRRGDRAKKIALACVRVLAACVLSTALGAGAVQGYQWATKTPLFAVRAVKVRGNLHVQASELIARSGLLAGQNLFRVDLAAAARGVESSPWVISASVSRQLPSSIEIEVREHQPFARVQLGAPYFSDVEGKLFKRVADDDLAADRALPLITGLARADWDAHRDEATTSLRSALELISDWHDAGLPDAALSEVRADADGAFTAVEKISKPAPGAVARDATDPNNLQSQEIRVGRGPFAANLHRLIRVQAELQRRGAQASRIDLDNPSRPDEVAAQIVRNDDPSTTRKQPAASRGE